MNGRRIRRLVTRTGFKDPERALRHAAQRGRDHGRRDFPAPTEPGGIVDDHVATSLVAEADTAALITIADHLDRRRPADDTAVAKAEGEALRRTTEAADARVRYAEAVHRLASVEARSPLAWWDRPWPPWLRVGLIVLMAGGSVANLAAGLVGVTADDPGYVLGYSVAIGAGLVGLGAACGLLLKRWELNRLRPGEHVASRSRVPGAVVALGLAMALALAVAVASIRATATQAEARRMDEAGSAAIVLGPDPAAPGDSDAGASSDGQGSDPAIPAVTWGILEGVLVAGALLVEYVGTGSGPHILRELRRDEKRRHRVWLRHRRRLARAWTKLHAACSRRAAHDAAAVVAGEATDRHADREVAAYRAENLASRPRGGALARFPAGGDALIPTADVFVDRLGDDLLPFEASVRALALAGAELERVVERPHLDHMSWELPHLFEPELSPGADDRAMTTREIRPGADLRRPPEVFRPRTERPRNGGAPPDAPPPGPPGPPGWDDEPWRMS